MNDKLQRYNNSKRLDSNLRLEFWTSINELPHAQARLLLNVANELFNIFESIDINKVSICTNLFDLNPKKFDYLKSMANELEKYAQEINTQRLNLGESYSAICTNYNYKDHNFALIEDHAGFYIYRWS